MTAVYKQSWFLAGSLFLVAALTDFFDGYCARLFQEETEFGKVLDPVADKILIFTTIWALYKTVGQELIPEWFVLLLLLKDFILIVGALFLLKKKNAVLNPSKISKWTTFLLMILIIYIFMIKFGYLPDSFVNISIQLLTLSTIVIFFDYAYKIYRL